ncbi:MAG: PAS domain-containing protein [Candidatus Competibacteraceae bacterium]|nr:PAS domain-containing protein [Candidatus Competibacteraceae bacterium]
MIGLKPPAAPSEDRPWPAQRKALLSDEQRPETNWRHWRPHHLDPATVSLLFTAAGLLWLLVVDPILATGFHGDGPKRLFEQWPNVLATLTGGILLYGLLQARANSAARAQQTQALRLSEFMERMFDGAFIKDRQGRYVLLNPAGVRLASRSLSECLNRDDLALFPADMARKIMEDDRRVIASGELLSREDTFTFQGDTRTFLSTKWPCRDSAGAIVGILGIVRDITVQKQAEQRPQRTRVDLEARVRERTVQLLAINANLERQIAARTQAELALRDSEERFRQLAEHIREVFWVHGIEQERPLYISPAYEDIWGRPIDGLHDRPQDWIEAVHPDDRARVQAAHVAKQHSGHFDEEYRIVRPDGTVRWIWDRGFPILDESGHIYRIAGLAEDITHRKLAEDQLRRQQVELARMSRLSLAVELASNLAHELNQPLAAIVAYTQACLALLHQANTDPRVLTGPLEEVVKQGLRAGEIIRHLRELVDKHPAAQSALDLNALIRSVVHYAQLEVRQAGVVLRLELTDGLPPALADDIQIQLVVLYLIRNALEAISAKNSEPREVILHTARLDAGRVQVTVRDTGQGLSPEVQDRLFQPFFTTKAGGMGLGLSVSRSIVESQGGQLWATSNPEGGASFHFSLPIHASS